VEERLEHGHQRAAGGSKIFIPVFIKGGLIWTGDSHCRQGNGEVSLTALECSYKEIMIQPVVRKDMKLEWPRLERRRTGSPPGWTRTSTRRWSTRRARR